ncbi:sigma-70 family RNA polymerase sigma factor [Anatilimnocola sp. NA78]|uniref:sigma-70 family RNA polymerase sigma factor n=1 Tax=Anatilimnocola sp. NA78 TaxID=3415683 RepID=UPI003CE4D447
MNQSPDDPLTERLRKREPAALAEYLQQRRPQLMAFIERQLGTALRRKVEPDDVFQEASAEAVRALPNAELSERDPFSWLCQIAERRIVDLHRRYFDAQKRDAGREVPLGAGGADTSAPNLAQMLAASITSPSAAFSRNVREARLESALQALPDDQREALRLRYQFDMPSKEIAEKLGKSDAAVRVMLTRSLKKLQQLLGEEIAPKDIS